MLNKELAPDKINIITDVRFNKYKKDEVYWLKKEINGVLIHLSRYDEIKGKRVFFPPANEEGSASAP